MFILFVHRSFYPNGGWHDFVGVYDSIDDAEKIAETRAEGIENWHIVDLDKRSIVKAGKAE